MNSRAQGYPFFPVWALKKSLASKKSATVKYCFFIINRAPWIKIKICSDFA